jgi:hypothetical protein
VYYCDNLRDAEALAAEGKCIALQILEEPMIVGNMIVVGEEYD